MWDKDGQPSAYSQPACWEIGLLERGAWSGQWIGAPLVGGPYTTLRESGGPAAAAPDVTFLRNEPDAVVYGVAAGTYHFTANQA